MAGVGPHLPSGHMKAFRVTSVARNVFFCASRRNLPGTAPCCLTQTPCHRTMFTSCLLTAASDETLVPVCSATHKAGAFSMLVLRP